MDYASDTLRARARASDSIYASLVDDASALVEHIPPMPAHQTPLAATVAAAVASAALENGASMLTCTHHKHANHNAELSYFLTHRKPA